MSKEEVLRNLVSETDDLFFDYVMRQNDIEVLKEILEEVNDFKRILDQGHQARLNVILNKMRDL